MIVTKIELYRQFIIYTVTSGLVVAPSVRSVRIDALAETSADVRFSGSEVISATVSDIKT